MVVVCWSVKGGSGTTVVAASLALLAARRGEPCSLADLAGEVPAVLGLPESTGPGLAGWLASAPPRPGLERLLAPVAPGVALLAHGPGPLNADDGAGAALAAALAALEGTVVVDAGVRPVGVRAAVVDAATTSLLVLRPCYLALRQAMAQPLRPTGVVLVVEPGRSLGRRDVEEVLGVEVVAEVEVDPAVARAVDAGLLLSRLPRGLERGLRRAA